MSYDILAIHFNIIYTYLLMKSPIIISNIQTTVSD